MDSIWREHPQLGLWLAPGKVHLGNFSWIHKDVMAPSEVIRNSIPPKSSQSGETVVYAGRLPVALPQVKLTFSGVLWYNPRGMIICLLDLWMMERGGGIQGSQQRKRNGKEGNKSLLSTYGIPFTGLNQLCSLTAALRNRTSFIGLTVALRNRELHLLVRTPRQIVVTCQNHPVNGWLSVAWSLLKPLLHTFYCTMQRQRSAAGSEEEEREGREGKRKTKKRKNVRELWNAASSYSRFILSEVRVIPRRSCIRHALTHLPVSGPQGPIFVISGES